MESRDDAEDVMSSGEEREKGIDGHLFRLIATFEAAAMQQMGKIANPITGDVEVSLEGARDSIEMLDMLKRRTDGNLNEDESRFLDHALYQLRMNYVDAVDEAGTAAGGGGGSASSEDTDGSAGGSASGEDTGGSAGADGSSEKPVGNEGGGAGKDEGA